MSIFDTWLERQKSAIADWVRRRLGLPDPYAAEPGESVPATLPEAGQVTGSLAFLWKPDSEADGKAVVILPCKYRQDSVNDPHRNDAGAVLIDSVRIEGGDRDGDTPRTIYWPEGRNGNRIHCRMRAKGEDFGEGFKVVVTTKDGARAEWKIRDGGRRQ
jgi:hypothetical protein